MTRVSKLPQVKKRVLSPPNSRQMMPRSQDTKKLPDSFTDPTMAPLRSKDTVPPYEPEDRKDFWSPREQNEPPLPGLRESKPVIASGLVRQKRF